jgi:hypothetical protein
MGAELNHCNKDYKLAFAEKACSTHTVEILVQVKVICRPAAIILVREICLFLLWQYPVEVESGIDTRNWWQWDLIVMTPVPNGTNSNDNQEEMDEYIMAYFYSEIVHYN